MTEANIVLGTIVLREIVRVLSVVLAVSYLWGTLRRCAFRAFAKPVAFLSLFTIAGYLWHYVAVLTPGQYSSYRGIIGGWAAFALSIGIGVTLYLSNYREIWHERKREEVD